MPIIKSAIKRDKQEKKRYAKNLRVKRALKDAVKAFESKPTFDGLRAVQSKIDTAVKKNILEKNTAARHLRRYARLAKDAGVKIPAVKKVATPAKTAKSPAVKKAAPAKKPATKAKAPVVKKTV
jgi:ribosomal protein S20